MDPPDDPGGTLPPEVGHYITVSNNDTSVDTDGSVSTTSTKRKRVSTRPIICKHCNKKRRKSGGKRHNDCSCGEVEMEIETSNTPSNPPLSSQINLNEAPQKPVSVARILYNSSDAAPFLVHVQREQTASNDNTFLNPISFGRFLRRNAFNGIVNGSLKKIGRNRLVISFTTFQDANSFITSKLLEKENFKSFIPTFSVTRMGVVRGVPMEWSDDEILDNISVPVGCGKILKLRRIKRKVITDGIPQLKNTETVILTFDGQILPKRVYMCYTSLTVDLYIYPTIQCYNCCRYGHVKSQCRSTPRCFKCGQGHSGDECTISEENLHCCLCKGYHEATSKKCLEYERQKNIKESMAKSCISYAEASKLHPTISKLSYADALISTPTISSNINAPVQHHYSPSKNKTSYKKTVFIKPRSPPTFSKGYEQQFHEEFNRSMPQPKDGCALIPRNDISAASVNELIIALIKTLTQSHHLSPNFAATVMNTVTESSSIINGQPSQGNPVELSKCNK